MPAPPYMTNSTSANKIEEDSIQGSNIKTPDEQYNQHPTTRLRVDPKPIAPVQNGNYEKRIENNLGEMSDNLARLKHLAIDLHEEIVTSNDLIDEIHGKVDNVDIKIGRQNKEMNKLLKK